MFCENCFMCFAIGIAFTYIFHIIGSLENFLFEKALLIRAQRKLINPKKDSFLVSLFNKFKGGKDG